MPAIHLSQRLTTRQRAEYADGWPGDSDPTAVLSSGQRRLWALAQMGGASAAYNEDLTGGPDADAWLADPQRREFSAEFDLSGARGRLVVLGAG
ncbi:MAG: hypothetical protein QOI68_565, partial [Pseudonocardiales bacterium]|nr:hypothetical protein [Pseudonocardiales bacterium]